MPTTNDSVEPSRRARLRYSLLRYQALSRSEFDGLSISSASSRGSLSIGTNSTAGTELSQSDIYDELEDLRIRQPGSGIQDSWSTRHREFLSDLARYLGQEPSLIDLKYMLKLRYISKSDSAWRTSVLIDTQSAQTKLKISSCLLKGPAIVRQLADLQLDLHVVQSRFGLSCATETARDNITEHDQVQILVDASTSLTGASIVVKSTHAKSNNFAVAGGVFKIGNKHVVLTALHPIKSITSRRKQHRKTRNPCSVLNQLQCVDGAISIYHEDVADGDFRLDCADDVVDQLNRFRQDETTKLSYFQSSRQLSSAKRLKQVLTSMRMGSLKPQANSAATMMEFAFTRTPTTSVTQSWPDERVDDASLAGAALLHDGVDFDWAALELSADNASHLSLLRQPNRIGGHVIDEIFDDTVDASVDVTLATADREIGGHLYADTVLYHVDGMNLELQVVRPDAPLPRGTSGSWVTHCNKFCGMVVAVSDDIPEAYILPANALIEDMERVCGEAVKLPQDSYPSPKSPQIQAIPAAHNEWSNRARAHEKKGLISNAPGSPVYRDSIELAILRSLEYEGMAERQTQLRPQEVSPEWIFDKLAFIQGPETDSDIFWISGRPGSGKSTLMKYLLDDLKSQDSRSNLTGSPRYFFQKLELHASVHSRGFIRALVLHELLVRKPTKSLLNLTLPLDTCTLNETSIIDYSARIVEPRVALRHAALLDLCSSPYTDKDNGVDMILKMIMKANFDYLAEQMSRERGLAQLTYQKGLCRPREQLANVIRNCLEVNGTLVDEVGKRKPRHNHEEFSGYEPSNFSIFFISMPEILQAMSQEPDRYGRLAQEQYRITLDGKPCESLLAADRTRSQESEMSLQAVRELLSAWSRLDKCLQVGRLIVARYHALRNAEVARGNLRPSHLPERRGSSRFRLLKLQAQKVGRLLIPKQPKPPKPPKPLA